MTSYYEMDPSRTISLGNGWSAAVAVGPDGDERYWLVSPIPQNPQGCACRSCAPHDQAWPATEHSADTNTGSNA